MLLFLSATPLLMIHSFLPSVDFFLLKLAAGPSIIQLSYYSHINHAPLWEFLSSNYNAGSFSFVTIS